MIDTNHNLSNRLECLRTNVEENDEIGDDIVKSKASKKPEFTGKTSGNFHHLSVI